MLSKKHTIRIIAGATLLVACVSAAIWGGRSWDRIKKDNSFPSIIFGAETIAITDWKIFGPIAIKAGQDFANTPLIVSGNDITPTPKLPGINWEYLSKNEGLATGNKRVKTVNKKELVDFLSIYRLEKKKDEQATHSFIAEVIVESTSQRKAYLVTGSDGLLKVWVNGVMAMSIMEPRKSSSGSLAPFNACEEIALKHGRNDIVIQVGRLATSCGLVAEIAPTRSAALQSILEKNRVFLRKELVRSPEELAIDFPGWSVVNSPLDGLSIVSLAGKMEGSILANDKIVSGVPLRLDTGIYTAHLNYGEIQSQEEFIMGDEELLKNSLLARLDSFTIDAESSLQSDTIRKRIAILFAPNNRHPEDREWQRKVVYTLGELQAMVTDFGAGKSFTKGKPGLHLRAFKSKIDNAVRHYRIYIPKGYNDTKKQPLAVIMPTAISSSRPFIESPFISHQIEADSMADIAERCGIALLWPGYPASPNANPCEAAHVEEVLAAVETCYSIDVDRITIMGTCEGAVNAMGLLSRKPGRFIGVALLDPMPGRYSNWQGSGSMFLRFAAYRQWIQENAPILQTKKMIGTPFLVLHDDGAPGHGSLQEARLLTETVRRSGISVEFQSEVLSLGHLIGWSRMIKWCAEKSATTKVKSTVSSPSTDSENFGGPVMEIFPSGFTLVLGTEGTAEEQKSIAAIADQFQRTWTTTYFSRCREVSDIDITPDMEASLNLILIGNPATNKVWQRLEPKLKVRLSDKEIVIGAFQYAYRNASVIAAIAHPDYPQRGLTLIGSSDITKARFGDLNLSIDGWYDFALWLSIDPNRKPMMAVAERIDRNTDL